MSFLDSLKHLVVEDDPNAQSEPVAAAPVTHKTTSGIAGIPGIPGISVASPVTSTPQPVSTNPINISSGPDANLTANFVTKLRSKLATSPFNAVLTQFSSTMESLSEAIPEEGNRFRAAMKVLAKQAGTTPEQLTEAYTSLVALLENEATSFKGVVEQQKANDVGSREKQVQQINAAIEAKNKEIQGLMEQRDGIATDIIAAKTKLGAAEASFEGAISSLQAEVSDSLQKLRIYFPTTSTAKK